MLAAALATIERLLIAGDRAPAIAELVSVWVARRDPATAELIDRISDAHTVTLPPIVAPTVTDRVVAWREIAAHSDPADLGRLLAVPWPRRIHELKAVIETLLAWRDDPRIAMALVRFVDEQVINTNAGRRLEGRALARVAALRDVRCLARLRAQHVTANTWRTELGFAPAIAALEAFVQPEPDPVLEDALARVAVAAPPIAGAATEVSLVAAILADPDDAAAIAVYGDWLSEREDPRGELIALQLARAAGAATYETRRRELELIAEHGRRWAGSLGRWFADDGRVFERGFLAGGRMLRVEPGELAALVEDPVCRLVRTLIATPDTEDFVVELLDLPAFAGVRSVGVVRGALAETIARGKPRSLVELAWRAGADDASPDGALATCAALPDLRAIGVSPANASDLVAWCARAPVIERIARIALPAREQTALLLEALAHRDGALRTIALTPRSGLDEYAWEVELVRDTAPGPFTEVAIRGRDELSRRALGDLCERLAAIPASWVRSLVVDGGPRRWMLDGREQAMVAAALARFTGATRVEVPWDRPDPAGPDPRTQLAMVFNAASPIFEVERFPAVWALLVDELGQRYDHFSLGANTTLRRLGDEPLARLLGWAKKFSWVRLVRDVHEDCRLYAGKTELRVRVDLQRDALLDWIARFAVATGAAFGHVFGPGVARADRYLALGGVHAPCHGWVMVFGSALRAAFDLDELAGLPAAHPELDGLSVRITDTHVLVAVAATPGKATTARIVAVGDALRALIMRQLARQLGYDFGTVVRAAVDPTARALGLVDDASTDGSHEVKYRHPTRDILILFSLWHATTPPKLRMMLNSHGDPIEIESRAELDRRLATAVAALPAIVEDANPKFT